MRWLLKFRWVLCLFLPHKYKILDDVIDTSGNVHSTIYVCDRCGSGYVVSWDVFDPPRHLSPEFDMIYLHKHEVTWTSET